MKPKLYEALGLIAVLEAIFAAFVGQFVILACLLVLVPLLGIGWLLSVADHYRKQS